MTHPFPRPALATVLGTGVIVALAGCASDEYLEDGYGRQAGLGRAGSVNGTAVLADMFRAAGHPVSSWSVLSPRIEKADVIVWFPDDFDPPTPEARERLEAWLSAKAGRSLVYVGRHFDAAPRYWRDVEREAPNELVGRINSMRRKAEEAERNAPETHRRLAEIRRRSGERQPPRSESRKIPGESEDSAPGSPPSPGPADRRSWFDFTPGARERATTLAGPWSEGIDAAAADVELTGRFVPAHENFEELLESHGRTIAFRYWWEVGQDGADAGYSQAFLIQNGSFLLNYPLVNHEHRKLAGKLIADVDDLSGDEAVVLFLQSDAGGPTVLDRDPTLLAPPRPGGEPPLSYVVVHGISAGVLAVFAAWPLFGRPRHARDSDASDFGRHVDQVGKLLEKTRDSRYCRTRVLHCQQTIRREATT
jgi:hypothetical protein